MQKCGFGVYSSAQAPECLEACVVKGTRYVRDMCIWRVQPLDMQQHAWKRLYTHADQRQRALPLKSTRIPCINVVLVCTEGLSSRDVPFGTDEGAALQRHQCA